MSGNNEYDFTCSGDDCNDNQRENGEKRKYHSSSKQYQNEKQTKKRRARAPRDINAPRMPLNGYVRFLNAHRERVKAANPSCTFAEITKLLAAEWSSLASEQKKLYLDEAEKAKEKYLKELQQYQQTEAYQDYVKKHKQKDKAMDYSKDGETLKDVEVNNGLNANQQHQSEDTDMSEYQHVESYPSTLELPIFTEEFLDHNKQREQELRQLRKLNTEYEEQNAMLSKHIDNMKTAIEKLEVEAVQQKNNNAALNQHLTHLRAILVKSFSLISIPGTGETPNLDNIDEYMARLHLKLTKEKTRETEAVLDRVQTIVANLDYNLV